MTILAVLMATLVAVPHSPHASQSSDGRELFDRLGCAACHERPGDPVSARLFRPGLRSEWLRASLKQHSPRIVQVHENNEGLEDLVHFLAEEVGAGRELGAESERERTRTGLPIEARFLERGRQLYHAIGCVACHDPFELVSDLEEPLWRFDNANGASSPLLPRGRVSLAEVGLRRSTGGLTNFLLAQPESNAGHPFFWLDDVEATALASYLGTPEVHAGRLELADRAGFSYRYLEGALDDELASFDGPAVREGIIADLGALPAHRSDELGEPGDFGNFGFRFEGFVDLATAGAYQFTTHSDDGSRLYVDNKLVVDNAGDHPGQSVQATVELDSGRHLIVVTYRQRGGDVAFLAKWRGPDFDEEVLGASGNVAHWVQPIREQPLVVDFESYARGAAHFDAAGCGACHPLPERASAYQSFGKPIGELRTSSEHGCLSEAPRSPAVDYSLTPGDRSTLAAYVEAQAYSADHAEESSAAAPADDRRWEASTVDAELGRIGCLACHRRGDSGPDPELAAYFQPAVEVDLGNEGRLPPQLTGVGAKLRHTALERIVLPPHDADARTRGKVRPYLAVRMPRFAPEDVEPLVHALNSVDAELFREQFGSTAINRTLAVETGRELAGTGGLGCIQCHVFGEFGSTGIPAVDLTQMYARVEAAWFRQLLLDPKSIGMNSRMAEFLVDGRSPITGIYAGDPERQIAALWSYLSLGSAMPLPVGLSVTGKEYELVPTDRPIVTGVFLKDVGPRCVLVGFPERLHYAFDVGGSRLAFAWRGAYFNARGTWHGRAGELEVPPSDDVFTLPPGPAFAYLEDDNQPWPSSSAAELGYRTLGRKFQSNGAPIFSYQLGDATFDDCSTPSVDLDGVRLARWIQVVAGGEDELYMRVCSARSIEPQDDAWIVDGSSLTILDGLSPADAYVRPSATPSAKTGGHVELLLRLSPGAEHLLSMDYVW